jgi:hypothetical protein
MVDLFRQFWWLIFPLWWMVLRLVRTFRQQSSQDRALEVLRIYASRGAEPPPEVLKAVTEASTMDPMAPHYRQSPSTLSGAWWTFFVFAALAGGFGYGSYMFGDNDAHTPFMIVAIIMSILAFGSFIMALAATFRGRP